MPRHFDFPHVNSTAAAAAAVVGPVRVLRELWGGAGSGNIITSYFFDIYISYIIFFSGVENGDCCCVCCCGLDRLFKRYLYTCCCFHC